jgi:DUF3048 family protein
VRRVQLTTAILATTSLLLVGCGGGGSDSSDGKKPASQKVTSSAPVVPATWPLTGLSVPDGEDVAKTRPVLVTKIDNTEASSPQLGLGKADMVVEELVEGGLTRLAAFYYTQLPSKVGPVRSMRASDIGIVSPVKASVVTSGAAGRTIARIKGAGIHFYQEGAAGISRDTSRSAPYNVFANLNTIAKTAKHAAARPDDYLPWGAEADFPGGQPAVSIRARFGAGHTTEWKYDGKGYVNQNTHAAEGDHFPADTVLVLKVRVGDAGYLDPANNPVPETKFTGRGRALIFHDGKLVRGTWTKTDLTSPIQLSTQAGPLTVPAGHTWVELVPRDTGLVTFTKK